MSGEVDVLAMPERFFSLYHHVRKTVLQYETTHLGSFEAAISIHYLAQLLPPLPSPRKRVPQYDGGCRHEDAPKVNTPVLLTVS